MVTVPSQYRLPTAEDLPDSDETPVDNELQNDIPNILLNLLREIWSDSPNGDASRRSDWFWGVDMGVYYEPNIEEPAKSKAIVPDGFLALGVPKNTGEGGRLSYVVWQEKVMPILALEVVSKKYNGEYDTKLAKYAEVGILYYVVYNSTTGRRLYKNHQSLEVYKLVDGKYQLLPAVALLPEGGKMVWIPEIGLGIGCEQGVHDNWQREWVYWYDRFGRRFATSQERATLERQARLEAEAIANRERLIAEQERQEKLKEQLAKQRAEAIAEQEKLISQQERQKKEKLAAYLRSLGINPDEI